AFSGAGSAGVSPVPETPLPSPGVVIIDGIALPFVNQTPLPGGFTPDASPSGTFSVGPTGATSLPPEEDLIAPQAGTGGLTQNDVQSILDQAEATARITRAVIRLPAGSRTRMTIAVADLNGTLLGLRRMPDGTVFSIDVAVAKARNVIWFSTPPCSADLPGVPASTAVTNRTISFG